MNVLRITKVIFFLKCVDNEAQRKEEEDGGIFYGYAWDKKIILTDEQKREILKSELRLRQKITNMTKPRNRNGPSRLGIREKIRDPLNPHGLEWKVVVSFQGQSKLRILGNHVLNQDESPENLQENQDENDMIATTVDPLDNSQILFIVEPEFLNRDEQAGFAKAVVDRLAGHEDSCYEVISETMVATTFRRYRNTGRNWTGQRDGCHGVIFHYALQEKANESQTRTGAGAPGDVFIFTLSFVPRIYYVEMMASHRKNIRVISTMQMIGGLEASFPDVNLRYDTAEWRRKMNKQVKRFPILITLVTKIFESHNLIAKVSGRRSRCALIDSISECYRQCTCSRDDSDSQCIVKTYEEAVQWYLEFLLHKTKPLTLFCLYTTLNNRNLSDITADVTEVSWKPEDPRGFEKFKKTLHMLYTCCTEVKELAAVGNLDSDSTARNIIMIEEKLLYKLFCRNPDMSRANRRKVVVSSTVTTVDALALDGHQRRNDDDIDDKKACTVAEFNEDESPENSTEMTEKCEKLKDDAEQKPAIQ